ncbi:MAG TPA: GDSL-type esterase/lipase family protein [Tepidisphaeraceae bacterium]|jgi:lysophospholipase L1-like esterase|nr:GDSL-type esterase/lipase family protein [Tepidisphaeraceae bacterium]
MLYNDVELHNVTAIEAIPGKPGMRLQRVPDSVRADLNEGASGASLAPTSCEVRFVTKSPTPRVKLYSDVHHEYVHVSQGDFLQSEVMIEPGATRTIELQAAVDLPGLVQANGLRSAFAPTVWRLRLSGTGRVHLVSVDAGGLPVRPPMDSEKPAKRWLAYGSSITQGFSAPRLANPYVVQAARQLGVDVYNVGFGGSCHAERELTDYFAARDDWDLITCELGINLHNHTMPIAEAADRFAYLARTLGAAQPDKPVVLITAFFSSHDLRPPSENVRMRADSLRAAVRDAAANCGCDNVTLIEGTDLLPSLRGLSPDLVHPSDHGMTIIADNLAARLAPLIG